MMAALASPACWMVCSESVSSLLGNVVKRANVWVAYCGRALKQTEKNIHIELKSNVIRSKYWFDFKTYFTTNDRKSLIVCVKLKRPDSRLPSAKRICIGVVGCAVSKFNFWVALKDGKISTIQHKKYKSNWQHARHIQLFVFFILAGRCWQGSCNCCCYCWWCNRCATIVDIWRWAVSINSK